MLFDLTVEVSEELIKKVSSDKNGVPIGHLGTHFDVMNQTFSLDNLMLAGKAFDVSQIRDRDIDLEDIDFENVKEKDFVLFHTAYIDEVPYASEGYFINHPQLSVNLIDVLLGKKVSIIGIDAPGLRRGKEHTPMDQHCADQGVFIVENLMNLDQLLTHDQIKIYTFPVRFGGVTGLPCRVVAEV